MTGLGRPVVSITGSGTTRVLTGADSGAIVRLGGADFSTVTLPAVQAGLNFRFVAVTAFAHLINGGNSVMEGGYHHNSNTTTCTRVAIVNKVSLKLHASNPMIGDTLECWCDGVSWYFSGIVNHTITQA
tara:strand:+ start:265 stop:651 length:387 start_codon:yes stop_codon:yes gene_type:complete